MKTQHQIRRTYFLLKWALNDRRCQFTIEDRIRAATMLDTLRWACDLDCDRSSVIGKLDKILTSVRTELGVKIDVRGNVTVTPLGQP